MDRFASNFDWGTRETHGNVLTLDSKLSGSTFVKKKRAKIVIYDKGRVNVGFQASCK